MSAAANWSYTAKATVWPLLAREDWGGAETFGAPEAFACDYSGEAKTVVDAKGREFVSRLIIFTERSDLKQGDRVALGIQTAERPEAANAIEVRQVRRHADTFVRRADDYEVIA
jgi:hypothetical protein